MKILFTILAIVCVFIVCGCYELQQQEHSETISNVIGCIASVAFIMSGAFLALFSNNLYDGKYYT